MKIGIVTIMILISTSMNICFFDDTMTTKNPPRIITWDVPRWERDLFGGCYVPRRWDFEWEVWLVKKMDQV